jgi:thiol-disulfide isomerase/thioredoxin
MRIAVVALLFQLSVYGALVSDVRARLANNDFAGAQQLIQSHRKSTGLTPESIQAESWLGRAALAQKQYAQALRYAAATRELCLEQLKHRKLDAEPDLPIALGATIEVNAQALAGQGQRSEGVSFLKDELKRWYATSIRTRIQKNLHLLSLTGTAPPALDLKEHLGPKPPPLTTMKGKPVLLFFWAHWCADCKSQGPVLARLRDKYAAKGLTLIAPTQYYGYVAGGEDAPVEREKPYIERIRREFYAPLLDVAAPLSQENFRIYGASTTPTIVLLDRKGIVRMYHPGAMTYEDLAAEIEKVL